MRETQPTPKTSSKPRVRSARLSDQARREQLLLFGRRHFSQRGFGALPMKEIAARAGVSKGLLYHYFGGRRGFYLATVTDVIDGLVAAMSAGQEEGDAPLIGLLTGFLGYVEENADIYQALVRGGLGADPEVCAQLDRVKRFAIHRLVGEAEIDALQRIQLVGWIAWIETATSSWLDTTGVSADLFLETAHASLAAALVAVLGATAPPAGAKR